MGEFESSRSSQAVHDLENILLYTPKCPPIAGFLTFDRCLRIPICRALHPEIPGRLSAILREFPFCGDLAPETEEKTLRGVATILEIRFVGAAVCPSRLEAALEMST